MIEIILGCVVAFCIIAMILTIYSNKFSFAVIKINEAESNIDVLFDRKIDLLERTRPIIKKELKLEEFLEGIENIKETGLNHFDLNKKLRSDYKELYKVLDDNEKLFTSEALSTILFDLEENEEHIIGSIKFYNDNVVVFNQLVASFPAKIVALFKGYKSKEFYSDEEKEMEEIVNN